MKKTNLNNKGFSLVELIIVIAIMAVLIGILAPQYLGYVEKSKKSTDVQNAQQIAQKIAVEITDAEVAGSAKPLDGTSATAMKEIDDAFATAYLGQSTAPEAKANGGGSFHAYMDGETVRVCVGGDATKELYPTVATAWEQ